MNGESDASPADESASPKVDNQNTASDGAQVGQQVGFQVGDTTIHQDSYTYHVNQDDPPERRHDVARNLLDGGAPRRAEEMFAALIRSGWISTERAYYYTLSMMSERSLTELSGELLDNVREMHKYCSSSLADSWSDAFSVVWDLLRRVRREVGEHKGEERTDVAAVLSALPLPRQEEIARHMDVILKGLDQEWWESDLKLHMMRERIVPERASQSAKFFEADPAEPRPYPPYPMMSKPGDGPRVFLGSLGLLVGVFLLVSGPLRLGIVPELLLLTAGFRGLFRHGVVLELIRRSPGANSQDFAPPGGGDDMAWEDDVPARSGFGKNIGSMVDRLFKRTGPGGAAPSEKEGEAPYKAYRAYLKNRLVKSYRPHEVEPVNLRWLVEWHVARARGPQAQDGPDDSGSGTVLRFFLGFLAVVAGLIDALWAQDIWAVFFLASGGWFAVKHGVSVEATRKANHAAADAADALYREELDAYRERVEELADRPTDAQIARWHALDKFYLVSDVIKRVQVKRDHVLEYVVLTECAPFARRSRLQDGPPRYEAYTVHMLLLTWKGLRLVKVRLDAFTGEAQNEVRFMFRYDAVVSAKVTEKGTRTTAVDAVRSPDVENLRSKEFRLVLSNGEAIEMKVNTFKSWQHSAQESESDLMDVAYETSGIENALPILEAIAAEGEGWIAHEQERRKQWSHEWDEVAAVG
ncbi:hypothetical protein [Umezawaea tangerina]|uniref:Uncharacterized protein n=1 Tax=Umezawaea tangerina TaxID=84725 RepID=A0A2T0SLJ0_9PSEU|nr:hypothetical protein [Umezawaea tangerina]PRY34279.1 hypothetical protein CLV43_11752 [Umezawaea tangerina]